MLNVYVDGATEGPNGKLGSVSYVGIGIWIPELDYKYSDRRKGISNNEAEYMALIEAMIYCIDHGQTHVRFFSDSMNTITGAKVGRLTKNIRMNKFKQHIGYLKERFKKIEFVWIPREKNTHADELSKQALEQDTRKRDIIERFEQFKLAGGVVGNSK